jgi:uncharacterized protein (DUF885 family)
MTEAPHDHRAAAGVTDPELAGLLEEHWEATMRRWPTWASRLGDRRHDDLLPGADPEDHEARRREERSFLERARQLDPEGLDEADRLTREVFLEKVGGELAEDGLRFEEWTVSPRGNPVTSLGWLPEIRPLETSGDVEPLLARYRAFPSTVDGAIACLRLGLADGRVGNADSVRRTLEMVEGELARSTEAWAAVARLELADEEMTGRARAEATAILEDSVRPAFARYAAFLRDELLPVARTGEGVGLVGLPGGAEEYEACLRHHTGLSWTAERIHETGRQELRRIQEEFRELGRRALGTEDIPAIFARLRDDPELRFGSEEEIEATAARALEAANGAVPRWFGRLPEASCVVKRIPDHEAPFTTIAYYRPPPGDGSGPGEYRVNVLDPATRPRHEAEALAFHESVPGHHLQIALAQELPELPAFRRHAYLTAYAEGWALYAERLADEMGLYGGDVDRLGMLSFDAWRASRLVVDTGLHALGWSREQAVATMLETTPLAANNVDNEVDRYVNWPGQAVSYKIGQLEIRRLRAESERALGEAFDLPGFHDVVLGRGPLPLAVLGRVVDAWVEERHAG